MQTHQTHLEALYTSTHLKQANQIFINNQLYQKQAQSQASQSNTIFIKSIFPKQIQSKTISIKSKR